MIYFDIFFYLNKKRFKKILDQLISLPLLD
jgi:hypothetical protein